MEPRLALALLATLAALRARGLRLEASNGADRAEKVSTEGLDLEGRKAAHAELFEKDFTVELNMTEAHVNGIDMGLALNTDTDFEPVSVLKIRKTGLLEMWNKANPDRAVHLGDQLMRVNDIQWHHNSQTFAERIKGQFKAARNYKEGAKNVLTLYIQRPRKQMGTRYKSQRDDMRHQLYSKEFSADIPFEPNHSLGWTLNSSVDWLPPTIRNINQSGLVGLWNKEHPELRLYPGDEITKVNQIAWHHNSQAFAARITAQWVRAVGGKAKANESQPTPKVALSLKVQRPRSVVEKLEDKTFRDKTFTVTVPYDREWLEWGWSLQTKRKRDPITIASIDNNTILQRWNKGQSNPLRRVEVGDRILQVNKAQWHNHHSNFAAKVNHTLEAAREKNANITLLVQRISRTSYTRGWLVEIPAKEGQILGLKLTVDDDDLPVSIGGIRTLGAVRSFNEDNPDDAILPGDHVFKVNDILWRQNSKKFAQNLESQFTRSKQLGTMKLWVQRPGVVESESEDQVNHAEYTVELLVPSSKEMGWALNATEGVPVSIKQLLQQGSVASWNADNPLKDIQAGDQLVQVDTNFWHNNTKNFMKRLAKQLDEASKGVGKKSISVLLRRPVHDVEPTDEAGDKQETEEDGDVMGAEQ